MTDIAEGNKIIAEFMVWEYRGGFTKIWATPLVNNKAHLYREDEMQFHTSWDWLMPVVEKIEKFGYASSIEGGDSDEGYLCDFIDINNMECSCASNYTSKIEAVWRSVIQFIEWYNSLTSKQPGK